MPKLATKISLAIGAAAVAALVGLFAAPSIERAAEAVERRWVGRDVLGAAKGGPRSNSASESFSRGSAPLDVAQPLFPPSSFRRAPLSREKVSELDHNRDSRVLYDPFCQRRYEAWIDYTFPNPKDPSVIWRMHTNNLGTRDDEDVRRAQPDLRIVVTGDSHTDGVCNNADSFANVLEARLREARPGRVIEALNAGRGGYSFFEYLGVLERFLPFAPDVFVIAVNGGNDFQDVLTLQHFFQGTQRAVGAREYWPLIEKVLAYLPQAPSQAFLAIKDFTAIPSGIEVALQGARDVSTEIVVTCLRHGVHPIFVYIPPLPDAQASSHAEEVERLREMLELSNDDMRVCDRMADSYLSFLRELRVDVLDLRPIFRSAGRELYFRHDWHLNNEAHRLIGEALVPLVDAARPNDALRVRAAAASTERERELLSPGAPAESAVVAAALMSAAADAASEPNLELSDEPLQLAHIDADVAAALFPLGARLAYDERSWTRTPAGLDAFDALPEHPAGGWQVITNSLGLRSAREPARTRPALRAICAGNDRALGACANDEAWPALVERALARNTGGSVECWNAQALDATLQQQVGTFDRLRELAPDVFVVAVDGTTDFRATLRAARATRRGEERDRGDVVHAAEKRSAAADFADTLAFFKDHPRDVAVALRTALEWTLELQRRCAGASTDLVVMYVPPANDAEGSEVRPLLAPDFERARLANEDLRLTDSMASTYLNELRAHGVEVVDLRHVLQTHPRPCYWRSNLRLNLEGQRVVAHTVQPTFERFLAAVAR